MLTTAVLLSALTLWTLRAVVPAVLLGAWLAAVTEPISARLARRLGGRTRAATVLTLSIVLALIAAASVLILPVVAEASTAWRAARWLLHTGRPGEIGHLFDAHDGAGPASFLAIARDLVPLAEAALSAAASIGLQVFVFVITAYYMAIDGRRLQAGIERVSPLGPEYTRAFIEEFVAVGRGIGLSMLLTGVAIAASLGLTFWAVDAPRPYLLAALTFVAAMLPVGTPIVWMPVAALLAQRGQIAQAGAVVTVGVVVVTGLIDHGLRPWLVRFGRLEMHPLLIFLGLFGGLAALGGWGIFLGPLLVAMTTRALRISARQPIMARRSVIPGERVTAVPTQTGVLLPATAAVTQLPASR